MDTFNDIWKEVLSICKNQVSDVMYNMWLFPLEFVKFENDTVVFIIGAEFKKSIILDKFSQMIKDGFEQILGFPVEIDILVDKTLGDLKSGGENEKEEERLQENNSPFAAFTFDNFIVGKSNSFAYNMAMGVAEEPGVKYNPLLTYGKSGLGKTHLMFAIYNKMKLKNPDAIIIYTTGESFFNELIECITKKNTIVFHNKYRNADALLIDDIQYIQKGDAVQEEFFHTFNILQQAGKQIVLTSDVPPKEMLGIHERLRTRFESGVLADIQPPDIDMRKAIIKRKCQELDITLNENITDFIAQKIKNNVRQLEGTVKKIAAMTKIYGEAPNIEQVQDIIKDITNENQPVSVTIEKIIDSVSNSFGVTSSDIKSDKRQAEITQARQAAMYIIKELTDLTLKDIGGYFGKNHATVLHSVKQCKDKMDESPNYKSTVYNIIRDHQDKN
ncbi:MAG: chromosomal replication initiator protein DnaA [Clostridia bacterium]|nr:chromosomal replication initiator protein DnaA [Clostridia bacterium]